MPLIAIGIGVAIGTGGVSGGYTFAAPVATWLSAPTVAQATFQIDIPMGVPAGYRIFGQSSLDNFSSVLEEVDFEIAAGDLVDFEITDFAFSPFANGLTYARFWIADATDVRVSSNSNIIFETIAASGNAFFAPRYFGNRYFAERYFG